MQIISSNIHDSNGNQRAVMIDSFYKNKENKMLFSVKECNRIDVFSDYIKEVFPTSNVFINYRKKFAAIKISMPCKDRLKSAAAKKLDTILDGVAVKVVTGQGIIYRFPRG